MTLRPLNWLRQNLCVALGVALIFLGVTGACAVWAEAPRAVKATGRAAITGTVDKTAALRVALEDALYLAALEGGANVSGVTAMSRGVVVSDQFLVSPASRIMDYTVLAERVKGTLVEVDVQAYIGTRPASVCAHRRALEVTSFAPILRLDPKAPAWLQPVMGQIARALGDALGSRSDVTLTRHETTVLDPARLTSKNDAFDYTALTSTVVRVAQYSYAFRPEISIFYNKTKSGREDVTLRLRSVLLAGGSYQPVRETAFEQSVVLGRNTPLRAVDVLTRKSRDAITSELLANIRPHLDALVEGVACAPLKAALRVEGQGLRLPLGRADGVRPGSLALTQGINTPFTLLRVTELEAHSSLLVPIDRKRALETLAGVEAEIISDD